MEKKLKEVQKKDSLSVKEFNSAYLKKSKPIVLSGFIKGWNAYESWTPDYLKRIMGDMKLKIAVSDNGLFPQNPENGWASTEYETMSFTSFMELVNSEQKKNKIYYMQHKSIFENFPILLKDIKQPEFIEHEKVNVNLWIGSGGNITPIHYDFKSNFLIQIKGRKKVILYPPSSQKFLNTHSIHSNNYNLSRIDVTDLSSSMSNAYLKADAYECTLEPGDMLFIPTFWWHEVHSIDSHLTMSVNYWWSTPIRQWMTPAGLKTMYFLGSSSMRNKYNTKRKNGSAVKTN